MLLRRLRAFCAVFAIVVPVMPVEADGDPVVVWSDPPSGFVDVAQDRDEYGTPQGIASVDLEFSEDVLLTVDDIQVLTGEPGPQVDFVTGDGRYWTVVLDRPIAAGTYTILSVHRGRSFITFSAHPGDVNFDGTADERDLDELNDYLAHSVAYVEVFDINRDGSADRIDATRLLIILSGSDGYLAWSGVEFSPLESSVCCCNQGNCVIQVGSCPYGQTEVECPCDSTCSSSSGP